MNQYEQLIQSLSRYPSKQWVNHYFDLQKKLLTDLQITNEDPRLAMSLTSDNKMPVNIGQRYVIRPVVKSAVRCIVPLRFDEASVAGRICWLFRKKRVPDAKWIEIAFDENTLFSGNLYKTVYKNQKTFYSIARNRDTEDTTQSCCTILQWRRK